MCHQAGWWLPHEPRSIRQARRLVAEQFGAWGVTGLDDAVPAVADLGLVASELVTNAVKFSTGAVGLSVGAHRERLEVTVTDNNDDTARARLPDGHSLGGRGLPLVEEFSQQWGQDRRVGGGKTVWAYVGLTGKSVLRQACRFP